jgi:CRP/FNR family transcriptional regulator, cyclic AMP receptor protein
MSRTSNTVSVSVPLSVRLEKKSFKRGQNLFKEGDKGTDAYLIQKGYVTIWRKNGKNRVNLATRSEGEIVGEMALADDTIRSATVTAETDVEVHLIGQQHLKMMLSMAPITLSLILHQLLESLRTANDMIAMYAAQLAMKEKKGQDLSSRPPSPASTRSGCRRDR